MGEPLPEKNLDSTIVAIHQPNYIPWLGYFYKMAKCDYFVYLDSVQYPRGQSFAARNRIKTPTGPIFLTIPISVPHGHQGKISYLDVEFADLKWKAKHLRTIQLNYKRAPFFEEIFELYRSQLEHHHQFVELNIGLIETFAEYLEIRSKRVRLSNILKTTRKKNELIIDICKKIGAETYLSGTGGGKEYNDENLLNQHGIKLVYNDFKHPVYPQLWGDFIPNLSIIDLLFNCGPQSKTVLFNPQQL